MMTLKEFVGIVVVKFNMVLKGQYNLENNWMANY